MKKNYTKRILPLMALMLTVIFSGCKKDPQEQNGDEQSAFVNCIVDIHGSDRAGLSVMTLGSGYSLSSDSTKLYVQQSNMPQLFVVADGEDHVRMLHRGVVKNGQSIEINAHTSALAMVTCNPYVALVGDSDFTTITTIIENLQSFPAFESLVSTQIAAGKDLFDTNNTQLLQSIQMVFDELLGTEPDSMSGSKAGDQLPWADINPLRFEWINQSQGRFNLSNYSLVPTYYGTISTTSGGERRLVLPTISSYGFVVGSVNLLFGNEDYFYGDRVEVSLTKGEDNTIELTNLHDTRAVLDIGLHLLGDLLTVVSFNYSEDDKWVQQLALACGDIISDGFAAGLASGGDSRIKAYAEQMAKTTYEYMLNELLKQGTAGSVVNEWSKRVLKVGVKKIFVWYNAVKGVANLSMRIYYLIRYPNDINFCMRYDNDNTVGRCGGDEHYFSVSPTKQVVFSPGNLADGGRVFVSHQWEYGGYFGWGTGNNPANTSMDWQDYSDFYDWGDYIEGGWRTLSIEEWSYVLLDRDRAQAKRGAGYVNNLWGYILLPDSWVEQAGCSFEPDSYDGRNNNYSDTQWKVMEEAGAVFLPLAGGREGSRVESQGEFGFYWSSTPYSVDGLEMGAYVFCIRGGATADVFEKTSGLSVRLVRDKN